MKELSIRHFLRGCARLALCCAVTQAAGILFASVPVLKSVDLVYKVRGWKGSAKEGQFHGTLRFSAHDNELANSFEGTGIPNFSFVYDGKRSLMVESARLCSDKPQFTYMGCDIPVVYPFNVEAYPLINGVERLYGGLSKSEQAHARHLTETFHINACVDISPSSEGDYYSPAQITTNGAKGKIDVGWSKQHFFDFDYDFSRRIRIGSSLIPNQIEVKAFIVPTDHLYSHFTLDLQAASANVPADAIPDPLRLLKKGTLVSYVANDKKTSAGVLYDPRGGGLEQQAAAQLSINRRHTSDGILNPKEGSSNQHAPLVISLVFAAIAIALIIVRSQKELRTKFRR